MRADQYNSDKLDRGKPVNGHSSCVDPPPTLPSHRTKKKRRKSRSSDSGSNSSGSASGSRSSSSSSSRSSSSGSNSSKSRSPSKVSVASKIKSSLGNYLPHTEFDKQCTIIVRNLPHRIEGKYSGCYILRLSACWENVTLFIMPRGSFLCLFFKAAVFFSLL